MVTKVPLQKLFLILITYIRMIKMQRKFYDFLLQLYNLNPDGAKVLHQRNANLITLNRDAKNLINQKVQFEYSRNKPDFVLSTRPENYFRVILVNLQYPL
jgi:hypothetical protein